MTPNLSSFLSEVRCLFVWVCGGIQVSCSFPTQVGGSLGLWLGLGVLQVLQEVTRMAFPIIRRRDVQSVAAISKDLSKKNKFWLSGWWVLDCCLYWHHGHVSHGQDLRMCWSYFVLSFCIDRISFAYWKKLMLIIHHTKVAYNFFLWNWLTLWKYNLSPSILTWHHFSIT